MIIIDNNEIERIEALMSGIPNGAGKVMKRAAARGAVTLKSEAVKQVRKRYDIPAATVRANQLAGVQSSAGAISGIIFRGTRTPLYQFNGTSPKMPQGQRVLDTFVKGHQRKDTGLTDFKHAFIAQVKSGHIGVFQRDKGRKSISEVMGLSSPEMIGNTESRMIIEDKVMETLEKRIEHEMSRLIEGV